MLDKLVTDNMGILYNHAKYFAAINPKHLADTEDFFQEACIVLLTNYKNYDPSQGSWANYLNHIIFNGLANFSTQINSNLSISVAAAKLSYKIYSLEQKGYSENEILELLNISKKKYLEVKNILTRGDLQYKISNEAAPFLCQEINEIRELLKTDEDKQIYDLMLRSFTSEEIAAEFGHERKWALVRISKLTQQIKDLINGK